ncbi:putative damage-inducible protein DinB [Actinoalloteichus hoggarensis]|uniref:DinB superfamily protein n=1 Tax=Actinoalloteichus hoggarensis TaxID=1470176 RepID=A0A221W6J3_9PSEU|nr:DinB family protein [Actinoalloteichus hoggarensis]ASO21266.1 DinB superfamily protein [Actinoalloteichus hoggarensis]MBB5921198.1 putative damage-inducible protein DinB [Actinoalloteichus hoggarensis]
MSEPVRPQWLESEREVLLRYLEKMRQAVTRACAGLSDADLRAPGVPSGTNLLGLIQHLTWCGEHWFQRVFLDVEIASDESMRVPASRTAEEVLTAYRQAAARSDEIVRDCPDLATLAAAANPGEELRVPLRAIVAHMIEETGRHAGHADILREQLDGATGL